MNLMPPVSSTYFYVHYFNMLSLTCFHTSVRQSHPSINLSTEYPGAVDKEHIMNVHHNIYIYINLPGHGLINFYRRPHFQLRPQAVHPCFRRSV